jgi:hypothetical protein
MVYSQEIHVSFSQVPMQISCIEAIVCENFTTYNTLGTLSLFTS